VSEVVCFSCGTATKYEGPLGRREECPKCRADLHSCKNCQHYDAKAYNECREPSADVVREKDRANFCDFFAPGSGGASAGKSKADLLAAAEALFKKK
jgi:hypothetical protein